jgi:hypothetical protein
MIANSFLVQNIARSLVLNYLGLGVGMEWRWQYHLVPSREEMKKVVWSKFSTLS